jgi:predicted ABC-type exoprotein transport system permease subunit
VTPDDAIVPQTLRIAAALQITAGILDVLLMSWLSWLGISCLCSVVTLPLLSAGAFCGFAGFLLVPLGLLEIGAGGYGWMEPREGARMMRHVALLQMAAIVCGGLPSAVVGVVVRRLLASDDVLVYLEG